jgi:hypothetical protein
MTEFLRVPDRSCCLRPISSFDADVNPEAYRKIGVPGVLVPVLAGPFMEDPLTTL